MRPSLHRCASAFVGIRHASPPPRFRAVPVALLLLFVALAVCILLRESGDPAHSAGQGRSTGTRASPFASKDAYATRPGSATSADAVRVTFRPATPCEARRATSPGPRPPCPWAVPAPAADTERKLSFASVDLSYTDAPWGDILRFLSDAAGVRFDAPEELLEGKHITIQVRQLVLRHTLTLLLRQYDCGFTIADDGRILVARADDLPEESPAWKARAGLGRARDLNYGDERYGELAAAGRRIADTLRRTALSVDFESASLPDAVAFLNEVTKVNPMRSRRNQQTPFPSSPCSSAPTPCLRV